MHKKKILITLTINMLIISSIFGNNVMLTASQEPSTTPTYEGGELVGTKLEIKQPGAEFFSEVNYKSNIVPEVTNSSLARFITTIANGGSELIHIKSVDIFIYNSSNKDQTDNIISYIFSPQYDLKINTALNIQFDRILSFPILDESFTVFPRVAFTAESNTSLELYISPNFNYTLLSLLPDIQPPEFVVWTWFLVSFLFIGYVSFGWWGNRKLRNLRKQKQNQ